MDDERYEALKNEVDKLFTCDFIKESFNTSWLANPVLVKKNQWKVKDLCKLHWPQQSLPKR